ncbi:AAA-domain-containing protein [Sistotremastrum suecicum HHB10207 ss-3]|uniref:AAA-domain-containing protein n=1 Tax=Sistotremastrum suecicum HHB10207 ss-3 TaxID=1314776 RepID=A0A166ETQ7_9AGAM|nr:AAA-domain-containing protein [Sistotremastrum suecicum HHB10207 ss-3]
MSPFSLSDKKVYIDVAMMLATLAAGYYSLMTVMDHMGEGKQRRTLQAKGNQIMQKLGRPEVQLDEYEAQLASEIIHPEDITVNFSDIGGLEPIVSSLRETIIFPLLYPNLFTSSSALTGAPKGVLLYGPPGCGKTMLARALAKESGATFVNVKISNLTNKWFGESNKLVAGVFSLAQKCQPSIIFIDEIDAFLRTRSSMDHEVTGMMKAEFMTLWDGLLSASDRILVLGATNRPDDIDAAIIRRMPKRFAVPMPNLEQREAILRIMLKDTVLAPNFPAKALAMQTEGLSGSDLKEICRNAAMVPVREYMREHGGDPAIMAKARTEGYTMRPLTINDFLIGNADTIIDSSQLVVDRSRIDTIENLD